MARTDFDLDGDSPEAVVYEAMIGTIMGYAILQRHTEGAVPADTPLPEELAEKACRQLSAIVIETLQQMGHMGGAGPVGPGPNDEI